jgi:hypothetical protein
LKARVVDLEGQLTESAAASIATAEELREAQDRAFNAGSNLKMFEAALGPFIRITP